jgi:hypothetical protein
MPHFARMLALAGLAGCSAAGPATSAGRAPGPSGVGPVGEERVVLPAFTVIPAVAASRHTVYVATPDGLGILDRDFDRWLPPVTRLDGYPGGPVSAIAADPVEEGVWVATIGTLAYYRPTLAQIITATVPGMIDRIVFDERDPGAGAYLHGPGGWALASHTGIVVPVDPTRVPPPDSRLEPATLREVYQRYPAIQNAGALLTRDPELRSWPVIAGAATPDRSEVWLGTRGGGLFRVDPLVLTSEPFPFGPLETGSGALAHDAGGIWIAGLGRSPVGRGGLTFTSSDLQHWRWVEGRLASPLERARANALAVHGGTAWVATDRGLVRLDVRDPARARTWSLGTGLPSDQALSVAPTAGGTWVGTASGLAFVSDSGSPRAASRIITRRWAVPALLLAGDTLWVGSEAGVFILDTAADSLPHPLPIADGRLTHPVRALARSDSLLAIATTTELVVLDLGRRALVRGFEGVNASLVREVNALAMDARTIWVAGDAGVIIVQRAGGSSRFLAVPAAVPDAAYDVALDPEYAWIATRAGVVRWRRLADGGVR